MSYKPAMFDPTNNQIIDGYTHYFRLDHFYEGSQEGWYFRLTERATIWYGAYTSQRGALKDREYYIATGIMSPAPERRIDPLTGVPS